MNLTSLKSPIKCLSFLYLFVSLTCFAYDPINEKLSPNAKATFEYLEKTYKTKMLAGYNVFGHTPDIYEQTGKHGAIWARDIQWFGKINKNIQHVKEHGYILSIHWHWFFNNESAWKEKRKTPVDVSKMVTPGTPEYKQMFTELEQVANTLEKFRDAGIPILWRPLHETDGTWFWWSDRKNPKNTVKLWRIMYKYFTNQRQLNNLLWVYSASIKEQTIAKRKSFYPGSDYVDISGIDVYQVDIKKDKDKYIKYHDIMSEVSPGKMLALGESDAIPNPKFYNDSNKHRWLYTLPWWGAPHPKRDVVWATKTMRHEDIITLDELPIFFTGDVKPTVSITSPIDKGSYWFTNSLPKIEIEAADRDGSIISVALYANDKLLTEKRKPPFTFDLKNTVDGSYIIYAIATDNTGNKTTSNSVRIVIGKGDIAKNKKVSVSSGKNAKNIVDGDIYSYWASSKSDTEWLYIDLEDEYLIDSINLYWGWKIHPQEFAIEIATHSPELQHSWSTIHTEINIPYTQWKLSHQITLPKSNARYLKVKLKNRAGHQFWGGFKLATLEIPINLDKMPSLPVQIKKKLKNTVIDISSLHIPILILACVLLVLIYFKLKNYAIKRKMENK